MENNELIKYEGGLIKRVGNTIAVTNKLLTTLEPKLIPYRKKDKWGFCTPDKKIMIDCIYDRAEPFYSELANICIDKKWGYINKKGNQIIPPIYKHRIGPFMGGLATVNLAGKYGFIDKKGIEIIPCKYDFVLDFFGGFSCVRLGGKYGFIDTFGQEIIPLIYDDRENAFEKLAKENKKDTDDFVDLLCGLSLKMVGEKYGLIDQNENEIVPCIYDSIDDRGCGFSEGLIDVEIDGEWGFINKKGEQIIPCIYDEVHPFFEELAGALINGSWGFMNKNGEIIIPFDYSEVFPFSNGIAMIEDYNWHIGYINKKGIQYWED